MAPFFTRLRAVLQVLEFLDKHPAYTPEGWNSRALLPLPPAVELSDGGESDMDDGGDSEDGGALATLSEEGSDADMDEESDEEDEEEEEEEDEDEEVGADGELLAARLITVGAVASGESDSDMDGDEEGDEEEEEEESSTSADSSDDGSDDSDDASEELSDACDSESEE